MDFAEHNMIRRVRVGVGAVVDQPISSFKSGAPPLVYAGGSSAPSSDYVRVPEFPDLWFYTGPLPKPGPGQPLVPPHLSADMYAKIQNTAPAQLSPLAASLRQYYVAYQRTGGSAYSTGLATNDPNRPKSGSGGGGILDKITGAGKGLLSTFGLGAKPATPAGALPAASAQTGGGFLDSLLSPVGVVLGGLALGGAAYMATKKKGRRR